MPQLLTAIATAPIWKSPFRPFYLLGSIYCPLLMLLWLGNYTGLITGLNPGYNLSLWHGHEMVFGFFGAIVAGFTLTFIGSWAQTEELSGWRLIVISVLWVLGRLAFYFSTALPPDLVMLIDAGFYLVICLMILPALLASPKKIHLGILLIFGGICAGNALFHWGIMQNNLELATLGIRTGLYAIMIKLVVIGAFLTQVFTNNVLPEQGVKEIKAIPMLEAFAVLSLVFFIVSDLFGLDAVWRFSASCSALVIHLLRFSRWHTWRIRKHPIILIMHLAYLWLLVTFARRAVHDYNDELTNQLWLHAFTVGALGLMGISFMTRVVLRHAGRQLRATPLIVGCYALIFIAAIMRLCAYAFGFNPHLMILSAVLWTLPFVVYLVIYSPMLWQASLAKKAMPKTG